MGKNIVQKAEEEILKGRSHQEIFNEIAHYTDHDIHKIGEAIRKIPTPEKRKKYQALNSTLAFLLALAILEHVLFLISINGLLIPYFAIGMLAFLVYQTAKFKPNSQLIAGIVLSAIFFWNLSLLFSNFSMGMIISLLATAAMATIAFFLALKLPADYRLNRDLLKENPEAREDSLIFSDN